jgi:RNA polymerase sigma-70 factor (ECF subfamily)
MNLTGSSFDYMGGMGMANRTHDEWLALRCQLREPGAFEDLVYELERPLLYYATKLVGDESAALDVLQDVWMTVFRKIRKLKDPGALRPWIYRIVHGIATDRIRRAVSRKRFEYAEAEDTPESNGDPFFATEDAAAIHEALNAVDVEHREVLTLHFLEEFSITEIAGVLGIPEGTVKSRIHHAKKRLKDLLVRGGYGKKE